MRQHKWIVVILSVALLLTSCTLDPLQSEANSESEKIWNSLMMKCEDSYYILYNSAVYGRDNVLLELRNISTTTSSSSISEADKLNGIEWKGESELKSKVSRRYRNDTKKWDDWSNGTYTSFWLNLIKKKGAWVLNTIPTEIFYWTSWTSDCASIPK